MLYFKRIYRNVDQTHFNFNKFYGFFFLIWDILSVIKKSYLSIKQSSYTITYATVNQF